MKNTQGGVWKFYQIAQNISYNVLKTTWTPHDCHMNAIWTPHERHMVAIWMPYEHHMNATWLLHEQHMIATWTSHDCHMNAMIDIWMPWLLYERHSDALSTVDYMFNPLVLRKAKRGRRTQKHFPGLSKLKYG